MTSPPMQSCVPNPNPDDYPSPRQALNNICQHHGTQAMSMLLNTPQELLDKISCWLPASATASLVQTCTTLSLRFSRALHQHAISPVDDLPAIHWAILENHICLTKYLLAHDAELSQLKHRQGTPLHTACLLPASTEIIKLLLSHGAGINAVDQISATALHRLCHAKRPQLEHLELLIAHGADINTGDRYGHTPFTLAVRFHNDDLAWALLNHGAGTGYVQDDPRPPVHMVVTYNRPKLLQAMLGAGVDGNAKNSYGSTALLLAAHKGYAECIDLLIDAGVDLDAYDADLDTAVLLACQSGHPALAMKLISAGAVCHVQNVGGFTALETAAREGYLEVVQALLERCYASEGEVEDILCYAIKAAKTAEFWLVVELLEKEMVMKGIVRENL